MVCTKMPAYFIATAHSMIIDMLDSKGVFGSANNATCILCRVFCTSVLFILCLSFQGLFTCCTCSNTCLMLFVLCQSFHALSTCFTFSNACHMLCILCLSVQGFFLCFTCSFSCFAHIICFSAFNKSLTLILLWFCSEYMATLAS